MRVEFRPYRFVPHVRVKNSKVEIKLEKIPESSANWECEWDAKLVNGKLKVVCKKPTAVVINPEFAKKVKERFGEEGLKLIIAHEKAEAECMASGGEWLVCHKKALAVEKSINPELSRKLRELFHG